MDFRPRPESTSQKRVAPCKAPNYHKFDLTSWMLSLTELSSFLWNTSRCWYLPESNATPMQSKIVAQSKTGTSRNLSLATSYDMWDAMLLYYITETHCDAWMLLPILRTRRHSPRYEIWPVTSPYTILSTRCNTSYITMLSHDEMLAIWRCIKYFPAEAKIWCEVWCSNLLWIRKTSTRKTTKPRHFLGIFHVKHRTYSLKRT